MLNGGTLKVFREARGEAICVRSLAWYGGASGTPGLCVTVWQNTELPSGVVKCLGRGTRGWEGSRTGHGEGGGNANWTCEWTAIRRKMCPGDMNCCYRWLIIELFRHTLKTGDHMFTHPILHKNFVQCHFYERQKFHGSKIVSYLVCQKYGWFWKRYQCLQFPDSVSIKSKLTARFFKFWLKSNELKIHSLQKKRPDPKRCACISTKLRDKFK